MHAFSTAWLMTLVQFLGYPGLFACIFLESGVFFGFFLPGASLLFTAGILASGGVFNIWILIPLLALAAILGDSAGYWFGRKVGISLFFKKDSRFFPHEYLERAKDFYDKHGAMAVVLARFVPIVRTFAPIVAGVVEMRYRKFLFYNVIGALAWACGFSFAGYYLGVRLPFLYHYLTPIVLLIVIATTVPLFLQARKNL